ncbi:MAG: NAD-dependent epimerase [Prevotella sp.]|nr:NAD-dependent epimerase [Candidatus Equicola faecalis]
MKILVTGAAGFIGMHLSRRLLEREDEVVGLDNLNDYYPTALKHARLKELEDYKGFRFIKGDIADRDMLPKLFEREQFDAVMNLAAQAGVRYSIENPFAYVESNLVGFANILECCRHYPVRHLVYASSSSVYGGNTKTPFSEDDKVDAPVSLYAATKKANELMASCYSKLYGMSTTGLRFFTVYGPWGRPDMAPMLFAKAISNGEPIKVFNNGDMMRDFTYVADIVEGIIRVIDNPPMEDGDRRRAEVYNIGCSNPVKLMDFINTIEETLGRKAEKMMLPMQKGDVYQTYADTTKLEQAMGYHPSTTLRDGIREFIAWYQSEKNPLK